MFDGLDNFLIGAVISLPGIIIAMVIHEWAHARVAYALGDFTPKMMGRLTLNPAAHIDPIGLILLFIAHFGWAKPVQINPYNFSNPRRDDILVSLAGPGANFAIAFVALFVINLLVKLGMPLTEGMEMVFSMIILININFGIFNLLPIPPLDGSHVLRQILPYELAAKYEELQQYSFIFLIIILMTPVVSWILVPARIMILGMFNAFMGIFF